MRPLTRRIVIGIFCAVSAATLSVGGIIVYVQTKHLDRIRPHTAPISETYPVAIVLGAAILPNKQPSHALRDRLLVGEALWKTGHAEKILITGDGGEFRSDEISVMKKFLLDRGVPEDVLLIDTRGFRTHESCRRAKTEFHIEKAVVVTHRFHMARALYLCNAWGIDAVGITSDLQLYLRIVQFWSRDLAASVKAFWEINRR